MSTTASTASRPLSAVAGVQPRAAGRLFFIDNIRVFLTILVLLHHFMITYAHSGDWYYREGGQPDFLTDALGNWFCTVNQSYFMGLFLLISAYFVPGSYDRKGAWRFFKDRLIRLGIPLVVFTWVINPLFVYALNYRTITKPFLQFFLSDFFKNNPILGGGPLWFVEVLLIFSLVYVLWRLLTPARPATVNEESAFPGNWTIALFALLLGVAGFIVRLAFPMGYTFKLLNLQFPFFAQYIVLFIIGLIAYRRNWLVNLPEKTARFWLWISILFILLWAPLMIAVGAVENDMPLRGGWHWQALVAALWESFLCVGMCISVVNIFRRNFNFRSKFADFLVPNAYTAYIIHAPVITFFAIWMRGITLYPLLKWALFAPVALALCFGLSALIRKIPYTDRVL